MPWIFTESYADSTDRLYLAALMLVSNGDPETAAYLFGLAAECALKATMERAGISIDKKSKLRVHIPKLLNAILLAGSTRHMVSIISSLPASALDAEYSVDSRYAANSSIGALRCTLWQKDAEAILNRCGFVA